MTSEQKENTYQSYLRHVLFWTAREGWPHFTEEEIRLAFERCERELAYWREQARLRRPPADEVRQELPQLIAADMKRRGGAVPVKPVRGSPSPLKGEVAPKPQAVKTPLPGSVPLP